MSLLVLFAMVFLFALIYKMITIMLKDIAKRSCPLSHDLINLIIHKLWQLENPIPQKILTILAADKASDSFQQFLVDSCTSGYCMGYADGVSVACKMILEAHRHDNNVHLRFWGKIMERRGCYETFDTDKMSYYMQDAHLRQIAGRFEKIWNEQCTDMKILASVLSTQK
jgi:hypothetical protein